MQWQKLVLLLPMLFLLIGCDSLDAKAVSPIPTVLEVTRSSTIPQNHLPPFSRTITNVGAVQKLYIHAQALPRAGVHTWMCVIGSTVVYHVKFLVGKTVLQQWDMDAVGCYAIMLHQGDLRQPNQAFVSLFAKTIGLTKLY